MILMLLVLIPVIVGGGFFIMSTVQDSRWRRINFMEFLVMEALMVILMVSGYYIARQYKMTDTEIWSGYVTDKQSQHVSCEHSYSCNCTTDSEGRTTCDTCYEHFYDVDWNVYTNNGEAFEIARVDRQGVDEPPRWSQVKIGDPTAIQHRYVNYIKANPYTLFKKTGLAKKYTGLIPRYPINVYDYHYCDRFIAVNTAVPESRWWNQKLQRINGDLGNKKQVNIIMLAVNCADRGYRYALEEAWFGGNKNDIVIILGTPNYPEIQWVEVMSWSNSEALKIELRDDITEIGEMKENREKIADLIRQKIEEQFERRHMSDFKYLLAGIKPPPWANWLLGIIGIIAAIGLSIYFQNNDPFHMD